MRHDTDCRHTGQDSTPCANAYGQRDDKQFTATNARLKRLQAPGWNQRNGNCLHAKWQRRSRAATNSGGAGIPDPASHWREHARDCRSPRLVTPFGMGNKTCASFAANRVCSGSSNPGAHKLIRGSGRQDQNCCGIDSVPRLMDLRYAFIAISEGRIDTARNPQAGSITALISIK